MTGWPRPISGGCRTDRHSLCFGDALDFERECLASCECGCHTERKTA